MTANSIFNPFMMRNFLDFHSLTRLKSHHPNKQILKRITEEISSSFSWMSFPENVLFILFNQFVVRVSRSCFLEWRISSIHYEKNHSWCKNIHTLTLIFLPGYLRSHIAFSSQFRSQNSWTIFTLQSCWKTKISQFKYEYVRQEYILWFNVPMSKSFLMKIMQSIHHLMKISSSNLLWEFTSFGNEIKQFSSPYVLQNNCKTVVAGLILFFIDGVFSNTDKFD